jgi:hypothetical protein
MKELITRQEIENKIFLIWGRKVILSTHLAELFGITPKTLLQAIKLNPERFPDDFVFQLDDNEYKNLKSQFAASSRGGLREANPCAFTEEGIAMLSAVLKSKKAIQTNIAILRAFVKIQQIPFSHDQLIYKLGVLKRKKEKHDHEIETIFNNIKQLVFPKEEKSKANGLIP